MKVALEVFIDLGERFFELLPRNLINLANRRSRIFNGGDQILPLGIEESVPLGSFAVLFERHHVDRTHGVKFRAHLSIRLIAGRKFVARHASDCGIGEQSGPLDPEFIQAGLRHVGAIGFQFGGGCLQLTAPVTGLVE